MSAVSILVAVALAGLVVVLLGPIPALLDRAGWPERCPRAALALWQAVIHAAGAAAVAAALSLAVGPLASAPRHGIDLFVVQTLAGRPLSGMGGAQVAALAGAAAIIIWLIVLLAWTVVRTATARRRHRGLVDLVADTPAWLYGTSVIEHEAAIAYCLPGPRSRIVISSGLIDLLSAEELAAVLDHERAHARGRHHLLLLPFQTVARAFPGLPGIIVAHRSAERLVEMLADDQARRRHDGPTIARALLRLATHRVAAAPLPAGALGAGEHTLIVRVRRLTDATVPAARWQQLLAYTSACGLLAVPLVIFLVPCLT